MGSDVDTVTKSGRLFHTRAAATGKARSPTVDSCDGGTTRPCVDAERRRRRYTKVSDTPDVVGEVRWRKTMKTAVNENSELVLDPLIQLQPIQLLQKWHNEIILPQRERETIERRHSTRTAVC